MLYKKLVEKINHILLYVSLSNMSNNPCINDEIFLKNHHSYNFIDNAKISKLHF
jgi:hypothetical protein